MKRRNEQFIYNSKKGIKSHIREVRRRRKYNRFKSSLKRSNKKSNKQHKSFRGDYFTHYKKSIDKKARLQSKLKGTVKYGEIITHLAPVYMQFSKMTLPMIENGKLYIPKVFSLTENNEESMHFIKTLFHCLYNPKARTIQIDYKNCEILDVDASAFMDLIIVGFRNYWNRCISAGEYVHINTIIPINWEHKPDIVDILFSIGSYKNVANKAKEHDTKRFIPFSIRIGDNKKDLKGIKKEIHETEIVDYVVDCLKELNHNFSPLAEKNLSKVVGEIMANAEEHSKFRYRFAIGYFIKPKEINDNLGVFKLSIFNFGQTIYDSFKNPENANTEIVQQMRSLSDHYTERGWFTIKKRFKEEVLWTLYSLQEGVTSLKKWRRGKGTIRFIDSFFKLSESSDVKSKLTLLSGNTQIIFDGTYPLKEKIKDGDKLKIMTFNNSGDIRELPDEKYVTFVPQFFPGTLISAKIFITDQNII